MTGVTVAVGAHFSGLATGGIAHAGPLGYGALTPDPNGVLDLPKGFSYEILAKGGDGYPTGFTTYDDGQKLAGDADGVGGIRHREAADRPGGQPRTEPR